MPRIAKASCTATASPQTLTTNGTTNAWERPLNAEKPHPMASFTSGRIFNFAWTRDGKELLPVKRENVTDVVLISNFR